MLSTVITIAAATSAIVGAAVAGSIILLVSMELTDDEKPMLKTLSRHLTVFSIPLLALFAYVFVVWAAKIIW